MNTLDTPKSRAKGLWILFSLLVFAALVRLPGLLQPWGGDQAVYGYIGWRMMDGEVPYRDLYSSTGYGIFFTNMWAMTLFGEMMLSAHIFDAIGYLLTVALLYLFAARLFDRVTAALACVLFILMMNGNAYSYLYEGYSAFGTYWYLCQRESFQTLLGVAAVALIYLGEERNRPLLHLLAGILIGLSIVYKLTAVLIFGFAGLYILFVRISNWRREGKNLEWLMLLMGWAAIPVGTVLAHLPFLYYFHRADSLGTMYQAVFEHTKIYAGLSRNLIVENFFGGHGAIFYEQFAVWGFAALAALVLLRFHPNRRTWLLIGWGFFSLMMVWMQKKFFGYHFIVTSAPLAILASVGIRMILGRTSPIEKPWTAGRPVRLMAIGLLAFNLILFLAIGAQYFSTGARYLAGMIDRPQYEHYYSAHPKHMYSVPADRAVAEFMRETGKPGDRLEIVNGGGENLIHFLADTTPYSRFTSTWYLLVPALYDEPYTSSLRRQFVDTVMQERPAYLLFILEDVEFYTDETHQDVKEFVDFVKANYQQVGDFPEDRYLYMPVERAEMLPSPSTAGPTDSAPESTVPAAESEVGGADLAPATP